MINKKNNLSERFIKISKFILFGATFLGLSTFSNQVKASAPPRCIDVLGTKDATTGKYSKKASDISVDFCTETPDRFEITIYELGLCTSSPFTSGSPTFTKENCEVSMISDGSVSDIAGKTVSLPPMNGRPANNETGYSYAYIIIKNEFGLRGSLKIDDGSGGTHQYCSKGFPNDGISTAAASSCLPEDHTEELDDFGDSSFSAYFPESGTPESMTDGGKVSALLVKDDLTTATSATQVRKLIGLFETDPLEKVVISDTTNGLEMQLKVTDIGYGISFNSGEPVDFGSQPFKPIFTTF